jgi:hypothetical protein
MRIYHKSITKECQKPTLMKICNVILKIKHITTSKVTDILELKKTCSPGRIGPLPAQCLHTLNHPNSGYPLGSTAYARAR